MDSKSRLRRLTRAELAEASKRRHSERFARQSPVVEVAAAFNVLHGRLVEDARLYESANLQDQRDAVAHALLAVADFLVSQGLSRQTIAPLIRPVTALVEREKSSLDLMFTERARPGRPSATLAQHERVGILAALAEFWLRSHPEDHRPQSIKLAVAARQMRGRWFGTVTRAQLKAARELVSEEAKNHPAVLKARMFYSWGVIAAELFGPENAFSIMVGMLNDVKLPFGAGEGGISKTPGVSPIDNS